MAAKRKSKQASRLEKLQAASLGGTTRAKKPRAKKTPSAPDKASKRSVSLYDADLQRVKLIVRYLQDNGADSLSVNASDAIRVALRTAKLDFGLIRAYRELEGQDLRRG